VASAGAVAATPANLVGHWNFDEGTSGQRFGFPASSVTVLQITAR